MNRNYPFYIEREERPTLSQQLRDAADALKIFEELKKSGEKPKEDKKPEKGNAFRTYLILGCTFPFIVLAFMWLEFTIFIDILEKAQAIKLK
jgi:hypothetical protein